jgi:hypothetical protein
MARWRTIPFHQEQLIWLEDVPDCYVEVLERPSGEAFDPNIKAEILAIRDIPIYVKQHPWMNLWRSWEVYADPDQRVSLGPVPLLVDIDDQDYDLCKAYTLTDSCLNLLEDNPQWAGEPERIRVIFTGRKGFHLEIKPPAPLDAEEFRETIFSELEKRIGLIRSGACTNIYLDTTLIDRFHKFIRITGSCNSWKDENGILIRRRVLSMTPDEFRRAKIEDIVRKSSVVKIH